MIGVSALCLLFVTNVSFAQNLSVQGLFDKALSLSQKGNDSELANVLSLGTSALEKEANTGSSDLKSKLLGQVGALKNLIPLASQGKLKTDVLSKIINTVKLLIGANQLSNMLSGGKSGLLGNAAGLTSSLGLLKSGLPALGDGQQNKLGSLLNLATKSVSKLDKSGLGAKIAASFAKKRLGKIVDLVKTAI